MTGQEDIPAVRVRLTLTDFALRVGLDYQQAYRAFLSGRVKGERIGHALFVFQDDVDRFLAERHEAAPSDANRAA